MTEERTSVRKLDPALEAKPAQLEDLVVFVVDDGRSSEREIGEQENGKTQVSGNPATGRQSLSHRDGWRTGS